MNQEYNDSRIPLAYLITFRCYGTWLHGDERGSVDRDYNVYGTPFLSRDANRETEEKLRMRHPAVELNEARRVVVQQAIEEVCTHRSWKLLAINVRTNHVHVVVSANCESKKVLNDFKAYTTRGMRTAQLWKRASSPWAEKGSRRYLWKAKSVDRAIEYVLHHQGDDLLPDFEDDCDDSF